MPKQVKKNSTEVVETTPAVNTPVLAVDSGDQAAVSVTVKFVFAMLCFL